jgi:hypothetical protein
LEVEILVDLWHGIVDVCLVVAIVIVAALVEEAVQELVADLLEARLSDDVSIFIRANSMGGRSIPVVYAI